MKKYKNKRRFFTKEAVSEGYIKYTEFIEIHINGNTIYADNFDENSIKNLRHTLYRNSEGYMDLIVINTSTITLYGKINKVSILFI